MKKNIKIAFALFAFTVSSLFYMSCEIKNPTEGLSVIVNTITRQTTIAVNISDPSGLNVTSPLTVKFSGPDSSKVIDEVNNKIDVRRTTDGNFSFCIKEGVTISESSPVKLVLQVRADSKDYLDVDCPVTVTSTGNQSVYVKMIKKTALKDAGVDQVANVPTTGSANPTTGAVVNPVSVSTPSGTQVTIPTGAVLKDANGAPLSGQINVSVTTFNQQATNLLPSQEVTINNSSYSSAMAFSLQVADQNGRIASSLGSTNSRITLPLTNVTNPSTGNAFQAGDKVEFCYIDANGNPQSLGQGTVSSGTASAYAAHKVSGTASEPNVIFDFSKLPANFSGNSLIRIIAQIIASTKAYYCFDFGKDSNPNNVGLELRLKVQVGAALVDKIFPVTSQQMYVTGSTVFPVKSAVVVIKGSPLAASAVLNNPVYKSQIPQAANDYQNLPVTFAGLKYFDIFVQGKCPSDNTKLINPSLNVYVTKNSVLYGTINLTNGVGGIYLNDGTYTLVGTYKNEVRTTTATVSGQNVQVETRSDVKPMSDSGPGKVHYYILTSEACS